MLAKHRISISDFYVALRQRNVVAVREVECVFIEANGSFSVYLQKEVRETKLENRGVLLQVPAYKALCQDWDERHICEKEGKEEDGARCKGCDDIQNELASDTC